MTAPKKVAAHADFTGAKGQKDTQPEVQENLDAMLEGLLKSTPKLAQPGTKAEDQRCGLVAIVGKPNVGKSTLLNALVGQKISITSRKAQTTRHRITGMHTLGNTQFVFVDTPGFQTLHANALNKSLNKTVQGAVADVDLILFVVEAGSFTPADARVLALLGKDIPTLLIANKLDNVHRRGDIAPWLQTMTDKHKFAEFVPMSAKNAKDIPRLLAICEKYLPEQAWWYAEDELTDRSEKFLASELVREKLFRLTGDELPYTSTVIIDKFEEEPPQKKGQKRLLRIAATIVVERDTHKAMVIGDKGERIKRIGMETRVELEKLADAKVFLEMWVKVRSGWADDEARVRSFGYE
ncbi:GTPase Era [Rhodoferax saidenbachensis]|uniref:GTPase Era n=2 Tax=Rhodoferax saidenbachensis TaxID=1484693 RepID=A0A1P8KC94_9BURK|nr:GTPase Era [Rhodoferax saidenbachensis]